MDVSKLEKSLITVLLPLLLVVSVTADEPEFFIQSPDDGEVFFVEHPEENIESSFQEVDSLGEIVMWEPRTNTVYSENTGMRFWFDTITDDSDTIDLWVDDNLVDEFNEIGIGQASWMGAEEDDTRTFTVNGNENTFEIDHIVEAGGEDVVGMRINGNLEGQWAEGERIRFEEAENIDPSISFSEPERSLGWHVLDIDTSGEENTVDLGLYETGYVEVEGEDTFPADGEYDVQLELFPEGEFSNEETIQILSEPVAEIEFTGTVFAEIDGFIAGYLGEFDSFFVETHDGGNQTYSEIELLEVGTYDHHMMFEDSDQVKYESDTRTFQVVDDEPVATIDDPIEAAVFNASEDNEIDEEIDFMYSWVWDVPSWQYELSIKACWESPTGQIEAPSEQDNVWEADSTFGMTSMSAYDFAFNDDLFFTDGEGEYLFYLLYEAGNVSLDCENPEEAENQEQVTLEIKDERLDIGPPELVNYYWNQTNLEYGDTAVLLAQVNDTENEGIDEVLFTGKKNGETLFSESIGEQVNESHWKSDPVEFDCLNCEIKVTVDKATNLGGFTKNFNETLSIFIESTPPKISNGTAIIDRQEGKETLIFNLHFFDEPSIVSWNGAGSLIEFTNTSLLVDTDFPLESSFQVSDWYGNSSPEFDVDFEVVDNELQEAGDFNNSLSNQRIHQNYQLINDGNDSLNFELILPHSRIEKLVADYFDSGAFDDGDPVTWTVESSGENIEVVGDDARFGDYSLLMEAEEDNGEDAILNYHDSNGIDVSNGELSFWINTVSRGFYGLTNTTGDSRGVNAVKLEVENVVGNSESVDRLTVTTFDDSGEEIASAQTEAQPTDYTRVGFRFSPSNESITARMYNQDFEFLEELEVSYSGETSYENIVIGVKSGASAVPSANFDGVNFAPDTAGGELVSIPEIQGSIESMDSVNEKGVWAGDWITQHDHDFEVDSDEVFLDENYTGLINLTLENAGEVDFTDVILDQTVDAPDNCFPNNSATFGINSGSTIFELFNFECTPGTEGSPFIEVEVIDNETERVWYNTTDLEIFSNVTRKTPITWRIDRNDVPDSFDDRDTGSVEAYFNGDQENVSITVRPDFVDLTCGVECGNSSLSKGTHSGSLTYTVFEGATDTGTVVGGGGTSTPAVDEVTFSFSSPVFRIGSGDQQTRSFSITHTGDDVDTVQVTVPPEDVSPQCDIFRVQSQYPVPVTEGVEYGRTGVYTLDAGSEGLAGKFTRPIGIIVDLPDGQELEELTTNGEITCRFRTLAENGEAGTFTATVRITENPIIQFFSTFFNQISNWFLNLFS